MVDPSKKTLSGQVSDEMQRLTFLEAVCKNAEIGMVLMDIDQNIIFSNEKALFFGSNYLNQDFNLGISLSKLSTKGRASLELEKGIYRGINFAEISEFEVDVTSDADSLIWLGIKIKPISIDQGIVSGVSIEFHELTARRAIELELKRTRSFYETVLNNVPADIAVFDLDHNYLFLNIAAIPNDEMRNWLIGKSDYDYFARKGTGMEIADARRAVFNEVISTQKIHERIDEHLRPDGSIAYKLRRFYPYTEQGELKLVIGYGIDVTELKNAQKTVLELLEKERGLSDLKTQFIQMASHEFRTPMASIQTSMDILMHHIHKENLEIEKLAPVFNRHHGRIEQEIGRITEIMNNILLMGRLDAGRMFFNPTENDIAALIGSVVDEELYSHIGKTINFIVKGKPYWANVDRSFISYMLKNLISNAFKYGKEGGTPEVILEFEPHGFSVKVIDQGIGIPEEEMHNLFQSFYRASNAENVQGTGLGLVIVKKLAEMHDGQAFGESVVGKGSTFGFFIPNK